MDIKTKNYVKELVSEVVDKKVAIQKAIFRAGLPGAIVKEGLSLKDVYKQVGFSNDIIEKHLSKGIKSIDKSVVEDNPYYKNISLENVQYNEVSLEKITFSKNEIDIVDQ